MIFKINLKNQLSVIKFHLSGTLIMLIALFFLNFDQIAIIIFGCVWLFYSLPTIYLHLRYYFINKGQQLQILNETLILSNFKNNTTCQIIKFNEIKEIYLCRSASQNKGSIPLSPIESYQYVKIIAYSENKIIVTCLMVPDLILMLNYIGNKNIIYTKNILCLFSV